MNPFGEGAWFANENDFKRSWIKWRESKGKHEYKFYCIESSETEKGFPDVMIFNRPSQVSSFAEFKIIRTGGWLKFTEDQPLFYKRNPWLKITVIAWDARVRKMLAFDAQDIVRIGASKIQVSIDGALLYPGEK